MNAVSNTSNNFMEENCVGTDSDTNSDDTLEYYQPISAEADNESESESQFHILPNGYSNGVVNEVSSLELSDDDDTKRREEEEEREREEAANADIRRAMREDERRRNAPLTAENANRVLEAMRGVRFSGVTPVWADTVPEEQWIDRIRRAREHRETSSN